MISTMKLLPRPQINVKAYSACHVNTMETLNSSDIYFVMTNNIARYSQYPHSKHEANRWPNDTKKHMQKEIQMKSKKIK